MPGKGYEHACFISYKRIKTGLPSRRHLYRGFVDEFQGLLREYLTVGLFPYFDANLGPGVDYPAELQKSLCKSLCLVAVLTPEYFESAWCRAEWEAMEKLEKMRLPAGAPRQLIIPILLRGDDGQAGRFCGPRNLYDLSTLDDPKQQLKNLKYRRQVETIAKEIKKISGTLTDCDCGHSVLKVGPESLITLGPDVVVLNHAGSDPNPLAA